MRLHRFHIVTPIEQSKFDITDKELLHQWKSVFRYNVGSQVILFDGTGTDYLCMITSLRNLGATVEVVEKMTNSNKSKINLWLCVGILKKDNFELVVQKATELGVSHIVPVLCERTEKKNLNMERLQKIVIESSEQSGRGDVPMVHEIISLTELLDADILPNSAIVLNMEGNSITEFVKSKNPQELAVFVGPEGGWSVGELLLFNTHNIESVSLGSAVLRAETASIAAASLLLL